MLVGFPMEVFRFVPGPGVYALESGSGLSWWDIVSGCELRQGCWILLATYESFRKLGVPYFGVRILSILLFRVLY